uniref:2-(3-amino-3-carboxypropyl)histidine synthase subunit 2 n=1 Tax=Echinostoma caproni TaxID=27848 RepID=A0A183B882_9TREM
LSKLSGTLPVLFVFGNCAPKRGLGSEPFQVALKQLVEIITSSKAKESTDPVPLLITYDFRLRDLAVTFVDALITYEQTQPKPVNSEQKWHSEPVLRRGGRTFHLSRSHSTETPPAGPWSLVYLGSSQVCRTQSTDAFTLYRILLSLPEVTLGQAFSVDASTGAVNPIQNQIQLLLRRRSYLIEKAKDAERVGILMGTLSVRDYRLAVDRVERLLQRAGRFYVTLVVGRLNQAKLANLPELDLLVLIACPESSLLDSRDLLVPVITPFELECALGSGYSTRSWTGEKWWLDFRDLLPGGACYCSESDLIPAVASDPDADSHASGDVSLITGKLRALPRMNPEVISSADQGKANCLVTRTDWSLIQSEMLSSRSSRTWYGLDPTLGQHEVSHLKTGRSGVPTQYDSEQAPE